MPTDRCPRQVLLYTIRSESFRIVQADGGRIGVYISTNNFGTDLQYLTYCISEFTDLYSKYLRKADVRIPVKNNLQINHRLRKIKLQQSSSIWIVNKQTVGHMFDVKYRPLACSPRLLLVRIVFVCFFLTGGCMSTQHGHGEIVPLPKLKYFSSGSLISIGQT